MNNLTNIVLAVNIGDGDVDKIDMSKGAFAIVTNVFTLIGVVIIFMTIWRAVQGFAKGDFGKVARVIVGGGIAAVLCLNLELGINLITSGADLATGVVETIQDTLKGSGSGTPSGTPTAPAQTAPANP